jgi:C-terminal processing protease CtpA/Prc
MMKVSGCTLVGAQSYGASGNPNPHDLGNDVTVFLSSWQDMLPDGTPLEGRGVTPDVKVDTTPAQLEKSDPVLEAALKLLR